MGNDVGNAARRWSFGPAVLDERTLELSVNGAAVSLERKPLEVLLFLLHHAGEVVTKDEILGAVWPGRVLSDSALTKAMGAAGRARVHEQFGVETMVRRVGDIYEALLSRREAARGPR